MSKILDGYAEFLGDYALSLLIGQVQFENIIYIFVKLQNFDPTLTVIWSQRKTTDSGKYILTIPPIKVRLAPGQKLQNLSL